MSALRVETERLLLTPLTEADAIPLAEVCNQPHIVTRMPDWRMTVNGAKKVVNAFAMGNELNDPRNQSVALAVRLKDGGALAGFFGAGPRYEIGYEVEIGYFIAKRYLGRGLATEAVAGMLGCARDTWGLAALRAIVAPENLASARVLAKNGFEKEKSVSFRYGGSTEKREFDVYIVKL